MHGSLEAQCKSIVIHWSSTPLNFLNAMRRVSFLMLALFLMVDLAVAQETPKRKSGLWEITRTSTYTEEQPRRIQFCIDQATDDPLRQLAEGMRGEVCTTSRLFHDGDKLVVDATCKLRASTSQTHAVISGQFDSAYTVESKSTYSPPLAGAATGHAQLVAKWTGPCAPGQHPGDEIMGDGATVDSNGVVHASPNAKSVKLNANGQSKAKQGGAALPPGVLSSVLQGQQNGVAAPARTPVSPTVPGQ